MERASVSASKLIRELAALAQRLAESDIVITSLRCDWSNFGFWAIQAQQGEATEQYIVGLQGPKPLLATGPEVIKCLWDNRDRVLTVGSSPAIPLCAPNQWKEELSVPVDNYREAMDKAERFILDRCGQR